ncbi:Uncharacterized protein B5E38_4984 [Bacillus cereus]|nr:Uncharacterized protein B5E38_4984 [Bacillus cereus]ARO65071.1 Uncharacterized protein B5E39_2700 [Bacillus cereus]
MTLKIKPNDPAQFFVPNGSIENMTDTSDLAPIIPQVIADSIEQKLIPLIKFTPLATVDTRLQGAAGMSVTFPTWSYIGDAKAVDEGGEVSREEIKATSKTFVVAKAAKDIALTDESRLATNGAVVNEVDHQIALALANYVDNSFVANLREAKAAKEIETKKVEISQAGLAMLRVAFGEDIENTVLVINPADYGKILAMPEFVHVMQGQAFMAGHVGHVMGLNIVVSERVKETEAFMIRVGGLGMSLKRQVSVETERLMKTRSTVLGADIHFVTYVRDATKLMAVELTVATEPEVPETKATTRKAAAK